MQEQIPNFLYKLLLKQYSKDIVDKIIEGYKKENPVTIRVNTLKSNVEEVKTILSKENIIYKKVEWYKNALIIENVKEDNIRNLSIYKEGKIYMQSLSSMLPAILLEPRKNENILDMTAAPGGKTTQIAALSNNESLITACEKNKIRYDRLKYNIEKQGATRVNIMREDARMLSDYFSFDKILLDAPCSGSGTSNIFKKEFSEELIKRSIKTQEVLLKKALTILKKGQIMVYSTCSILKEENENILNKTLANFNAQIIPIDKKTIVGIPLLNSTIEGTITIRPTDLYEGFFACKIKKK